MPESWFENEAPGTHLEARCPRHGVLALGPRAAVVEAIAVHVAAGCGRSTGFTIAAAPYRCDLCGAVAEPPWWTHEVSPPLFDLGDADGLWLVCDPCHDRVAAGDLAGLTRRAVTVQRAQSPDLPAGVIRAHVGPRFAAFLVGAGPGTRD